MCTRGPTILVHTAIIISREFGVDNHSDALGLIMILPLATELHAMSDRVVVSPTLRSVFNAYLRS